MKKLLSFVFALMMIPFMGVGECSPAQQAEDLTVRVVTLNEKGKDIINTKMSDTKDLYNWVFGLTSPDYDYYDFGDVKNRFDISVPYESPLYLATESTEIPVEEQTAEGDILDGATHMSFNIHEGRKLELSVLIPNEEGFHKDGNYNYKYAVIEDIPLDKGKILIGGIEQYGEETDKDYLIVVSPKEK